MKKVMANKAPMITVAQWRHEEGRLYNRSEPSRNSVTPVSSRALPTNATSGAGSTPSRP